MNFQLSFLWLFNFWISCQQRLLSPRVKEHDQGVDTSSIPLMVETRETDQRMFKKVLLCFHAFMYFEAWRLK